MKFLYQEKINNQQRVYLELFDCSLYDYLVEFKQNNPSQLLEEELVFDLILKICSGLDSLHQHHIIHRNIQSNNIFIILDQNNKISKLAIGAFGNAILTENENQVFSESVGSFGFMAPEIYSGSQYNNKCDIYSFGALIYEIITLSSPFNQEFDDPQKFYARRKAPDLPPQTLNKYQQYGILDLYQDCTNISPESRPSCSNILFQFTCAISYTSINSSSLPNTSGSTTSSTNSSISNSSNNDDFFIEVSFVFKKQLKKTKINPATITFYELWKIVCELFGKNIYEMYFCTDELNLTGLEFDQICNNKITDQSDLFDIFFGISSVYVIVYIQNANH